MFCFPRSLCPSVPACGTPLPFFRVQLQDEKVLLCLFSDSTITAGGSERVGSDFLWKRPDRFRQAVYPVYSWIVFDGSQLVPMYFRELPQFGGLIWKYRTGVICALGSFVRFPSIEKEVRRLRPRRAITETSSVCVTTYLVSNIYTIYRCLKNY